MVGTMAEPKRHVSRWHPVPADRIASAPNAGEDGAEAAAVTETETETPERAQPEVSLRYLNEFVGKLQCASALLDHQLYPDAKEITESMGVFNAVRKYVLQDEQEGALEASEEGGATAKADGIVVVGDGSTPRTAAMFAHRLRHWKSYSVDPAMEYRSSERSVGWETISNLVVIRNKIENVRITLRRAIVVLVHAHVTLEQALSAVEAERVVGVVTLPCCNWFSQQETLFARRADLVYDDFSILSDKREVRLWVGGDREMPQQELAIPDAEAKVCIRKVFLTGRPRDEEAAAAIAGSDSHSDGVVGPAAGVSSQRDENGAVAGETKCAKALSIFSELLTHSEDEDDEAALSRELPSELMPRLLCEAHILVLDSSSRRTAAIQLLKNGYKHVYVLCRAPTEVTEERRDALSNVSSPNNSRSSKAGVVSKPFEKASVALSLVKLAASATTGEAVVEQLQGVVHAHTRAWTAADVEGDDDAGFVISFDRQAPSFAGLDCIVDNRFVHRGFRDESRNAPLFRTLCSLAHQVAAAATAASCAPRSSASVSFVCVTPRKNWRKKEYLGHIGLQFEVLSVPVKQSLPTRWELKDRPTRDRELTFVFCCTRIHRGAADRQRAARALESQREAKDAALAMKRTLRADLRAVRASLEATSTPVRTDVSVQQALELAPGAAQIDASVVSDRTYVQVLGKLSGLRRYTKGMAFLSLEPPFESHERERERERATGGGMDTATRQPLQAFLQRQELPWPPARFQDVLQMLHPGDLVSVLGFFKQSERGTPLLSVAAIEFVRGEFEAYE
ncbi:hypothetical protein PybrP1_011307 [[Pythium] brassicae (nom. inval.)]|nr:hypothetical protein PybrP1_011307 [[Pythium] brassicae (nom. inval.)]